MPARTDRLTGLPPEQTLKPESYLEHGLHSEMCLPQRVRLFRGVRS